jgi:hypothetical protein
MDHPIQQYMYDVRFDLINPYTLMAMLSPNYLKIAPLGSKVDCANLGPSLVLLALRS